MLRIAACCALVATGSISPAFDAMAAANSTQYNVGAAMACRPALPAFDGAIRTRPLGMGNEGSTTAYVSCTNWSQPFSAPNYNTGVQLLNHGAAPVVVSCTLVSGGDTGSPPGYDTKTVTINAGQTNYVLWGTLANAGLPSTLRYSCALPPGVELQSILWGFVV